MRVAGVTSRTEKSARECWSRLETRRLCFIERIDCHSDLIIEAPVARGAESCRTGFCCGQDLMVISVGALLDHPEIIENSRKTGCRLYCPSGAIAGLMVLSRHRLERSSM